MLPLIYSEKYNFKIGAHVFPARKYAEIVQRLCRDGITTTRDLLTPGPADDVDLLLVHTPDYLQKLKHAMLTQEELWRLEIPYNLELFDAFRTAVGGTILAAHRAIEQGIAVHIGGGFHHAFPDHGEGFCVLNDVAIAARKILAEKRVKSVLIIDCDLHHGNGTATVFRDDRRVYTFSIHQQDNYPYDKPPSSMDVGLEDGAGDAEYLAALAVTAEIMDAMKPGIVFYLAGADPYQHDQLGGLALTIDGLARRDRLIIEEARTRNVPLAIVLAGGYAFRMSDTVEIHVNTILEAHKRSDAGPQRKEIE